MTSQKIAQEEGVGGGGGGGTKSLKKKYFMDGPLFEVSLPREKRLQNLLKSYNNNIFLFFLLQFVKCFALIRHII